MPGSIAYTHLLYTFIIEMKDVMFIVNRLITQY